MEISERHIGSLVILELRGRFEVSAGKEEVLEFRSAIAELVAEGRSTIALDLSRLASIDARGLGELVFTHNRLRAVGGVLLLTAACTVVRKMLSVTRLDTVLRLVESERDAVDWLQRRDTSQILHLRRPLSHFTSVSVAAVQ